MDSLEPYYIETVLGKTEHMTTLKKTRDDTQRGCIKQSDINANQECHKKANVDYDKSKKTWENTYHIDMLKKQYLVDTKIYNGDDSVDLREMRLKYDTRIKANHENDDTCSDCKNMKAEEDIYTQQRIMNDNTDNNRKQDITFNIQKNAQQKKFDAEPERKSRTKLPNK